MKALKFWENWSKLERIILFFAGLILFTCLSIYVFRFYLGENGSIVWETTRDVERVEQTLSSVGRFGETIELKGSNFVSRKYFNASAINLDTSHSQLYLGFICFAIVFILTGVSYIKKMAWFASAMTAVGVGLYFFSFDLLESFGFQNNTMLSIGFVLFIAPTALFNILKENKTTLLPRLGVISIVVFVFFYVVIANAQVELPIYYLTNYAATSLTVVVLVFSALVGYDIIASFFYIITVSKSISTTNTITNFLVITSLYLGSLLIFFLKQINYISWNITLFNPFILLFISTIFGFWGQHKRRELFLDVLNYRKGGIWIYMGLAILAISSIAYAFQTGNSAMIASFEEMIIYTHLTMGAAFVIYLMKNFRVPILQGVPVWEKLYFPSRLTHRFTRFIGVTTIVLLVIVDQNVPLQRWKSGLANYKADVYQKEGAYLLAEQNYQIAYASYPDNFKAQYTLAMMAYQRGDLDKTIDLFEDMVRFRIPNQYALANLANAYGEQDNYYNAHFTLKKAMTKYPNNGYLQNNMAYYAAKEKDTQNVYENYIVAQEKLPIEVKKVSYGNLLAFSGNLKNTTIVDSLVLSLDYSEELDVVSNRLVLANLNDLQFDHQLLNFNDTLIDIEETSYLINALNAYLDQPLLNEKTDKLLLINRENEGLMKYALALNACRRLQYLETDSLIKEVLSSITSELEPYYYFESGKMYLALGDRKKAEVCFMESYKKQPFNPINKAPIYLAELYLTGGNTVEGVELLKELSQFDFTKERANHILYALSFKKAIELDSLPTDVLADIANFNPWFIQSGMLDTILSSGVLNESVALPCFRRAVENKKYEAANIIFNSILSVESVVKSPFVKLRLEQLAIQKRYKELMDLSASQQLKGYDRMYASYFEGLVAERLGNVILAETLYEKTIETIPFYEPLGVTVVNFYAQIKNDEAVAYTTILNLIEYHQMSLDYNLMFIHLALAEGEFFFADEALKDIDNLSLMSPKEFGEYKEVYDAKRKYAIQKYDEEW